MLGIKNLRLPLFDYIIEKMILDHMDIARSQHIGWIHMYNNNKLSFVDNPKPVEKNPLENFIKNFRMYM